MAIQERTYLFLNGRGALRASSVAVVVRQHGPHSQQLPSQPEQLPTLVPLKVPVEKGRYASSQRWASVSVARSIPRLKANILSNVVEKK